MSHIHKYLFTYLQTHIVLLWKLIYNRPVGRILKVRIHDYIFCTISAKSWVSPGRATHYGQFYRFSCNKSKMTNFKYFNIFWHFWIGHTMRFQNMYNTFIYGFTFLPWKLNNRGHFAVFATNIIFLLIKKIFKNSKFSFVAICGAVFGLFLSSTI